MTKLETIIRLAQIRGILGLPGGNEFFNMRDRIDALITDLSDDECKTTAGNCAGCGWFHG